jgi:predicted phage tail protein
MRGGQWRRGEVEKFINTPLWQLSLTKGMAMDVEQAAVETSGAAEEALKSLKVAMDKFKSTLANDLTSIKAAGSRVQSEALQMKQAYQAAQAMLTTAEFERAVANAERMATALKAISELSETKLSVAVFSGGAAREG